MRRCTLWRLGIWAGCLVGLALLLGLWTHEPPPLAPAPLVAAFEGHRAFEHARILALEHPRRTTGSAADARAADWMTAQFERLGLAVERQEFTSWGAWERGVPGRHAGINIVAVSPGAEPAAVVMGAHRDVVPNTVQGAEDNASGSGALLELARVLAAHPHRLTYVFVSFGAEETGLGGSRHYLATTRYPLALMLSIDAVGQADGERLALVDSWSLPRAAAWDLAGRALAAGLLPAPPAREPLALARVMPPLEGITDSLPFALRGTPAVGVTWDSPPYPAHSPRDIIDRVSPASLQRVGALAETFVRAVDADAALLADSSAYLFYRTGGLVPSWQVGAAAALLVVTVSAQWLLALGAVLTDGKPYAAALAPPAARLLVSGGAAALGGVPLLLRPADLGPTPPELLAWSLGWSALVLLPPLLVWRRASLSVSQRGLLVVSAACLSFAGLALWRGPFFAALVAGCPLLVWSFMSLDGSPAALRRLGYAVALWGLIAWPLLLVGGVASVYLPEMVPPGEAAVAVALVLLPFGATMAAAR